MNAVVDAEQPGLRIVRVFPRRTSLTPDDALAFVGDPPLWIPPADQVRRVSISCTFTWDRPEAERLADAWEQHYPGKVQLGGPAYGSPVDGFTPGLYVKRGVTFTSRGCIRRCKTCLVPEREGPLRLLDPIPEGYIVNDNNFLACPQEHRQQVYAMLARQKRAAVFSGGLDCRLLTDEIAAELRQIRIREVFLAADSWSALGPLRAACERLSFLRRRQLRCYVLAGYGDDSPALARERLGAVWQVGAVPFVQLYRPADHWIDYSPEWRALAREFSRPAAMFANHKEAPA